ncbi:MAG: hypothetical protein CL610_14365 [Anaerolineaceae bacterium]|nr:hypothetical protein [Anaerolineaceae bacterium]
MVSKARADQVSGGVFLIGLALLFMTGYWWPGILFVIGASTMARGVAEGRDWYSVPGGLWMIGLGLVFAFGFNWPLLLILIGVSMLFGKSWQDRNQDTQPKIKNDDKPKNDSAYTIDEYEDGDETTVEDLINSNKSDQA